jgi:hypothetical protein
VETERLDKSIIAAMSKIPSERDATVEDQIRRRIDSIKSVTGCRKFLISASPTMLPCPGLNLLQLSRRKRSLAMMRHSLCLISLRIATHG